MPAAKGIPHKKPTKEEKERIFVIVQRLLALAKRPSEIKAAVSKEFGIKPRSVEPYLRRAREEMIRITGKSKEEHRADSYYFYTSILSKPDASDRDKLRARECIDKLLAIPEPQVIHGNNLNVDLTPEQLAEMSDEELASLRCRLVN